MHMDHISDKGNRGKYVKLLVLCKTYKLFVWYNAKAKYAEGKSSDNSY